MAIQAEHGRGMARILIFVPFKVIRECVQNKFRSRSFIPENLKNQHGAVVWACSTDSVEVDTRKKIPNSTCAVH